MSLLQWWIKHFENKGKEKGVATMEKDGDGPFHHGTFLIAAKKGALH